MQESDVGSSLSSSSLMYGRLIRQLNIATICFYAAGVVILVSGAVYAILSIQDWRKVCESDKICLPMVANEFIALGYIFAILTVFWFLHKVAVSNSTYSSKREASSKASFESFTAAPVMNVETEL